MAERPGNLYHEVTQGKSLHADTVIRILKLLQKRYTKNTYIWNRKRENLFRTKENKHFILEKMNVFLL